MPSRSGPRWIVACISHETNSFSPGPTTLDKFGTGGGPLYGQAGIDAFRRARIPFGAAGGGGGGRRGRALPRSPWGR